jgi:hypothetical protein
MQQFETSDENYMRRCKRSQLLGKVADLSLAGPFVRGMVHSIVEAKGILPTKWIVTFTPKGAPIEFDRKKLGSRW